MDGLVAAGSAAATVILVKAIYRRLVVRGEGKPNPTDGLELPAVRPSRDHAGDQSKIQGHPVVG